MRYPKVALVVFGLLFMLFLGWFVASQANPAYAQGSPTTIPKSWGPCKGGLGSLLIFEDGSGTVRLVDARSGKPEYTYGRQ
jgi:hypothetical protein